MRKRVKVSIPKLIKEILTKDVEYFSLKRERLCNIILQEMGYDKTLRLHDKITSDRKISINFNLNERNTLFFKDMIKESEEEIEAEFFRRLLSTYGNMHPSLREKVVRKEFFRELEYAIKRSCYIKIANGNEVLNVLPLEILRDQEHGYNLIKVKKDEEIYIYKAQELELLAIL